jgi:hypothetical protein
MSDPWEKAYVYGRMRGGGPRVAHIVSGQLPYQFRPHALCLMQPHHLSRVPKPYGICKPCLKTKRAKELGL